MRGNPNLWTLYSFKFKKHFGAEHGMHGSKNRSSGAQGEDIFIDVPLGTVVKDTETENVLFEITEKFNMPTQTPLLLLQKTMVVVEGVARSLDDDANIWDISKPILEGWLTREKGPKATIEQAIHTTDDMVSRLPEIPKIMDQATKALEVFISRSDASSSDPTIAKNLEVEKTKLKNEKNSFIIKILVAVVVALLIFK